MTAARADRLAARLADRGLDLLLVTDERNVRWLTGFTGDNALAIVGRDVRRFVTDFRYVEQAAAQVSDFERERADQELLERLAAGWPDGELRLGFDDAAVSVRLHGRLRDVVPDRIELVPAGGLVEELRAVKDADELARIRAAAELADDALRATLAAGVVGRTERAIALDLEDAMRRRGAAGASFPSIVAAGAHGALPHAEPRDVPVPERTLVTIDWGARLDGYCSDCTRTFATGRIDDDARAVYELVLRAQRAGLDAVRPGPSGRDVDAVAREVIERGGHGEGFGHGLGHGVGLDVHEGPRLSRRGEETLRAGNVVTVEPGVYLAGRLGVRIENLVAVTDDGHDVLDTHPKELETIT